MFKLLLCAYLLFTSTALICNETNLLQGQHDPDLTAQTTTNINTPNDDEQEIGHPLNNQLTREEECFWVVRAFGGFLLIAFIAGLIIETISIST